MLRASLRSSRAFGYKPSVANAGRQWHAVQAGRVASGSLRGYTDGVKPSIIDSKPIVLPGSASASTSQSLPPGSVATSKLASTSPTPATPSSTSSIPPQNVPLTPPPPPASTPPPPPPPPKPRKFFRRFFTTVFLLTVLGYGGGVYYSRVNDNFHDFFTEYIPFGEDAVLYFEEREFRKRFPRIANRSATPRDTGKEQTIAAKSGVSWRVAEDSTTGGRRHSNATKPDTPKPKEAIKTPEETKPEEKITAVEIAKKEAKAPEPIKPIIPDGKSPESQPPAKPGHPMITEAASAAPKTTTPVSFVAPEVDQPSKFPPEVTRIDPINIKDANEPVVQDLVKILNDIIAVVNADNSNTKFSSTINKAKSELTKVGSKIKTLKDNAEKDAAAKIKAEKEDFDRAAKELIRRVEAEMAHQQSEWQEEYQTERQKIKDNYDEKLKAEIERAKEVHEKLRQNELLEQAVKMKQRFIQEVKDRVEEERNGRLGKLSDLSNTVTELEKLTTDWNSVVDSNLKTQHLHVAVEAVRTNLEKSQVPRPFVRELAALKEIALDDPVVNAAIASINPTAYQRGIPSSAQLVDRFRRVATEVRKASLLPEDAGVASHASSYVLSKILFKKKGLATGDDVESILTRTETFLEEGDLDGAAREMNGLKGWAKTLSRDWLGEVRKVLEVQQALDVIATEARLQSLRVE